MQRLQLASHRNNKSYPNPDESRSILKNLNHDDRHDCLHREIFERWNSKTNVSTVTATISTKTIINEQTSEQPTKFANGLR